MKELTTKELAELALMHRRYLVGAPAKGDHPVMIEELLYDTATRLLELEEKLDEYENMWDGGDICLRRF